MSEGKDTNYQQDDFVKEIESEMESDEAEFEEEMEVETLTVLKESIEEQLAKANANGGATNKFNNELKAVNAKLAELQ